MIYNSVKRLNELNSEGISPEDITDVYYNFPAFGDSGPGVRNLQYYINYLSRFYATIPPLSIDGIFGEATRNAVTALQQTFELPTTGVVDADTWYTMLDAYYGILNQLAGQFNEGDVIPFPGVILRLGVESDVVALMQRYLNTVAEQYPSILTVSPTGYFGSMTEAAVIAFQELFGLPDNGIVDAATWEELMSVYSSITNPTAGAGQYPGFPLGS
ncbi:MAG: peptidoglycan-binding protein [Clostridia bacterium]|nr:peptidoglycan-binding protein [Clostridia bacterium]